MSESSSPSVNVALGNGIVEIATLTALIGSKTAESLTLGNKGAAGLPWAAMSSFGAVFVVRACVAAITPGWLRETLAVRNAETDDALGWSLDLKMLNVQDRNPIGAALGVTRKIAPMSHQHVREKAPPEKGPSKEDIRDVYTFDRLTSNYLGIIPAADRTDPLKVYIVARDAYRLDRSHRVAWNEALGLAVSTVKLVEVFILWNRKAHFLSLVTGTSWAFFFLGALILLCLELPQRLRDERSDIDILTGKLPNPPNEAGADRKVVLGAPPNTRETLAWKLIWFLGSLVCTASVVTTYIILSSQDRTSFYIWMGFQLFFLVLRSVFFHFAVSTDTIFGYPSLSVRDWKTTSSAFRDRVRGLVFALSRYQMHVHPRGAICYEEDLQTVDTLGRVMDKLPLPIGSSEKVQIHLSGVLGDTLLNSAAYVFGGTEKLTSLSLYDSCILRLTLPDGSLVSVPCARVATDIRPERPLDLETPLEPEFPPRGGSNSGRGTVSWNFWVPCEGGVWLQMRIPVRAKTQGEHVMATVLTDQQIGNMLRNGELFISLQDVKEVWEIVESSRAACRIVEEMLR